MRERGLPVPSDAAATKMSADEEAKMMESLKWEGAQGGVAVVKMGHFIGAQNFAGGMLALVRYEGKLPVRPGLNGIIPGAEGNGENADGDYGEETAGTAEETSNGNNQGNGNRPKLVSSYTEEEELQHHETLRQLKHISVNHLFQHQIPDPIPPDTNVPQSDPTPQDPSVPYNLLESLTTLRLRYEQSVKDEASKSKNSSLSTSVSYINDGQWGGHAAAADGNDAAETFKMDKAKIAAAAGGAGYDEEADPLNAPDVVAAVLAFKRRLEDQNAKGKKRRVGIITERMERKVKELLERGRKDREMRILHQQSLLEQQPQSAEVAERNGVEDTGRRGVSNLPAWMTKDANGDVSATAADRLTSEAAAPVDDGEGGRKRKFVPSEANRDINARKPRLDVESGGKTLSEIRAANEAADAAANFVVQTTKEGILLAGSQFPPLISSSPSTSPEFLKEYVTAQIVDYIGEEESTLIEFIMKALSKDGGCTTASLLEEMKLVLDEDAEDFVLGLYRKMVGESN